MSSLSARAAQLHARTIKVEEPGRITIKANGETDSMDLEEIRIGERRDETPARGFRCTAFGGKAVDVILATDGSKNDACDCESFAWRSTCNHALGLRALLVRGQLDKVPVASC